MIGPRDEVDRILIQAMRDALKDALELAVLAKQLTGCRGDDDYVWGLEAKFRAILAESVSPAKEATNE